MTLPSMHLLSPCPSGNRDWKYGSAVPTVTLSPDSLWTTSRAQLKKPWWIPTWAGAVESSLCWTYWQMGSWFPERGLSTRFSRNIWLPPMWTPCTAFKTHPGVGISSAEHLPASQLENRAVPNWNPRRLFSSLIYVRVATVKPSKSLTWPKGQIIIPFNCDKSLQSRQIFDSQLISLALPTVAVQLLRDSFRCPIRTEYRADWRGRWLTVTYRGQPVLSEYVIKALW